MSAERYTIDTNVLFYAVDRSAGAKHDLAVEIVNRSVDRACVLTVQALAEFVASVTRKGRVSKADAVFQASGWLALFPVAAASPTALASALRAYDQGRLGIWDALLLATAREAGCAIALSEDMHDGGKLLGVAVRNPFGVGGLPDDLRALLGMT